MAQAGPGERMNPQINLASKDLFKSVTLRPESIRIATGENKTLVSGNKEVPRNLLPPCFWVVNLDFLAEVRIRPTRFLVSYSHFSVHFITSLSSDLAALESKYRTYLSVPCFETISSCCITPPRHINQNMQPCCPHHELTSRTTDN